MPKEQIIQTLQALIFFMLQLSINVFYIVYALINFKVIKKYWKPGLLLGIIVLILLIPGIIFSIVHYDHLSQFEENKNLKIPPQYLAWILTGISVLLGTGIQILKAGWHTALYALAKSEWQKIRKPLYDPNQKQSLFRPHIIGGLLFGIFAGVISMMIFDLLNVGESQYLIDLRKLYPGMWECAWYIKFPIILFGALGAAISEELVFRGAILAILIKQCKTKIGVILAIALVSLIWGGLHILNTNSPITKITQVFILGFFFAEFTRRGSIESSIAAHIGLNATCVVIALFNNGLA